ncbi:coiled-coil domain-containing protein [Rubripirellula reticaptiva]|uniref:Uncharacterized protein n=1 Tax=Rubripirellula reticaptiva TaxID=2528013 RepID=A0A5C6F2J3_9BACT|nr:hypothetical protein [Rubripirellula reticaptiva]TWU55422.1 hypothetical protein Poly59_17200 [Rubripirellula reticaptiva]
MARKSRKGNRSSTTTQHRSAVPARTPAIASDSAPETTVPVEVDAEVVVSNVTTPSPELDANTRLLQQITAQIAELHRIVATEKSVAAETKLDQVSGNQSASSEPIEMMRLEVEELANHLRTVEDENDELRQQNSDLAAQLAASSVRSTLSNPQSSTSDALTWDERKALILQQMEAETFDADVFVDELQTERNSEAESPTDFVESLMNQLRKSESDLKKRDTEIGELRCLLEQPCEIRGPGEVVGAAAIAQMVDADELVLLERERLQQLQAEWEDKFRRSEIDASLERAKLSRERQELANKTLRLEEQIEHLQREARQTEESGSSSSRRWMVKLGLTESTP